MQGPLSIPTLGTQTTSAIYNPIKDLCSYLRGQRQDVKDLEKRMGILITDLMAIMSRKEEIDQSLKYSISIEKSDEYIIVEKNIEGIYKKSMKFINKYTRMTKNLPSPTSEIDVSTASHMIDKLEEIESKILTFKCFKLAKLSRDITKLSERAIGIRDRLKLEHMTRKRPDPNQERLHISNDLPVFNEYVDEVLGYLSEKGNRVGILGHVGVGKTTVLKKLYNQLIETKSMSYGNSSFGLDFIMWIDFPQQVDTEEKISEELQNEILVQLKIDHEKINSINQNAVTISKFLFQRKFILFMDQVSANIDLNKLGFREDHKYGKFVIASRDKKAISSMIEYEVEIKTLSRKDAWELFEKTCGKIYPRRLREIADGIIKCCGGIPLMINFVAKRLKDKKDESSWNDLKRMLQYDLPPDLLGLGAFGRIYEIEYKKLDSAIQKCLLYGALFPNESKIYRDYLIECWMAEGFMVEDAVQKLRFNRERGQTILNQLTDGYLLEWCSDKKHVKMPTNFRRVALAQKYPDEENCEIWVPSNDLNPNEKKWMEVTRMSLIGCNTMLPESPQCCNIFTLLLQFKPKLENLADLFFFHMQKLKVLDLNHTEIGVLPSSINRLVNLRSLYLNDCNHLKMLPSEAHELKKLEILDICRTSITSLPEEIRSMVELRCLRASFSSRGCNFNSKGKEVDDPEMIIPREIISSLKKLEELSIDIDLHSHVVIDLAQELARELASLEYLTTLCFNFPNASSLDTFVFHSKSLKNTETGWGTHTFRSFKISVGCQNIQHPYKSDVSKLLTERRFRFSTNEKFSSHCREVLKQACAFELIGHDSVETLSEFDLGSLEVIVVERCNRLKNIVNGYTFNEMQDIVEKSGSGMLQNLEKLHLYKLQALQCIWEGPFLPQSLIHLTVLTLNGCPKLTKILDPALASTLSNLKYLKVEDCCEISEIVVVPEGSSNSEQVDLSAILKSVEIVELWNLPKLQSICKSTSINWNSLNSIIIMRCGKLSNLSLTQTNAKKLASVECEESWWTPLQLPEGVKQRFLLLCRFKEESNVIGETSTSGRSNFDQASSNIPVIAHRGKERVESIKLTKSSSFDGSTSNTNVDKGAESPEEEMQGETSTCGRSNFDQASSNTDLVIAHGGGKERAESMRLSNSGSFDGSASDTNADKGAESPEEEMPGETSTSGTSIFNQASSIISPVIAYGGKERIAEQIASKNGSSIDNPVTKDADNGAESPEEEMLSHNYIQASNIYVEAEDEPMSISESISGVEILMEASSYVHDAPISVISPEDPNSVSISEGQRQQQFAHEIVEEAMIQEDRETETSRSSIEQKTGQCTLNENMLNSVGNFASRQAVELASCGEINVAREMTAGAGIISSSPKTERSKHYEESIPSPMTTDFVPEKEHYLVIVEDNKIKLKLDQQTILIGDFPSSAPPESSSANAGLVEQDFRELPVEPDFPNSLLLFRQRNKSLSLVHSSFSDSMRDLRFLDLSYSRIRILPSSLFRLPKLKVLMLRNCVCLEELPPEIKNLEHMEVLDLSGTELYSLPGEIGQLKLLKHMELSFYGPDDESEYSYLPSQLVSPRFLAELKELKALSITVHPADYRWTKITAQIIDDVGGLEQLSYLQFYFPEVEMFVHFIQSPLWQLHELSKCKFIVGRDVKRIVSRIPKKVESLYDQQDRCLRLVNGQKVDQVIRTVLWRFTAFYLDHHIKIQSLSEFGISNFHALKFCVLRECPKIQAILDNQTTEGAFPCLERLGIYYLWELKHIWKPPSPLGRLKKIWKRPVPSGNFKALKHLTVDTCPKLQFILCESMVQCLSNLEKLLVVDCERLEKIVKEEKKKVDSDRSHEMLPRLEKLVLRYLPKLVSLGNGLCISEGKISKYDCPKLILNS